MGGGDLSPIWLYPPVRTPMAVVVVIKIHVFNIRVYIYQPTVIKARAVLKLKYILLNVYFLIKLTHFCVTTHKSAP